MGKFVYHTKYVFVEKVASWEYFWKVMPNDSYYGVALAYGNVRAAAMSTAEEKVKMIMDRNPNRWKK